MKCVRNQAHRATNHDTGEHCRHPPLSLPCLEVPSKREVAHQWGNWGGRRVQRQPKTNCLHFTASLRERSSAQAIGGRTASPLGSFPPAAREKGRPWLTTHSSLWSTGGTLPSSGPPHAQQAMLSAEDRKFSHRDSSPHLPGP